MNTPQLGLPLFDEAQDHPETKINLGRYEVDALLQGRIISRALMAPPGGEAEGDAYIPAIGASGAWAGHVDDVAVFQGGGYRFYTPRPGWSLWSLEDGALVRFAVAGSPSTWTVATGGAGSSLTVRQPGSPSIMVPDVTDLVFSGVNLTDLGGGSVLVDPIPGAGGAIEIQVALSDMTTALTAGTTKAYVRAPCGFTLTDVRASLATASSTGGPLTVDINVAGATILSTKLTIDDTEKTSTTAATAAVISAPNIADDAEITFDIDDEGTGAAGLIVTLIGTR